MKATVGEQVVLAELDSLGLRAEQYSKAEQRIFKQKTPDFKVYRSDSLQFFCEVKDLTDSEPLEDLMIEVAPGLKQAEQMGDPHSPVNRVLRKVGEAVAQFDAVDPDRNYLRVLAIVNNYNLAGPDILEEMLRGYQITTSGTRFVTTSDIVRERMAAICRSIDFYWWIENHTFGGEAVRIAAHPEGSATFNRLADLFRSQA